jgi:hypothetical protein
MIAEEGSSDAESLLVVGRLHAVGAEDAAVLQMMKTIICQSPRPRGPVIRGRRESFY